MAKGEIRPIREARRRPAADDDAASATPTRPLVVILSTADYDSDVWTNKQHLASRLTDSFDVVFVNSLGLRAPRLNRSDVRRIVARLRPRNKGASTPRPRPAGLHVVRPRTIPFHAFAAVRHLNRVLLQRQLRRVTRGESFVLWTFTPLTYGLHHDASMTIYHSVDLLHTFAGVPASTVLNAEAALLPQVDHVIASSRGVQRHLDSAGARAVTLWENVADTQRFADASAVLTAPREDRVIFAGNLTPTKIDVALLTEIAEGGFRLAIAGPCSIDGTDSSQITALFDHPNVTYLGNLSLDDLAHEVARSKVGLIPYLTNAHTQGVFPMKVYEYLSAGCSVVSTPLPSLDRPIRGLTVASAGTYVTALTAALSEWTPEHGSQVQRAAMPYSWQERAQAARDLILGQTAS